MRVADLDIVILPFNLLGCRDHDRDVFRRKALSIVRVDVRHFVPAAKERVAGFVIVVVDRIRTGKSDPQVCAVWPLTFRRFRLMGISREFVFHPIASRLGAFQKLVKFGKSIVGSRNARFPESALRRFAPKTAVKIEIVDDFLVQRISREMRTSPMRENCIPSGSERNVVMP